MQEQIPRSKHKPSIAQKHGKAKGDTEHVWQAYMLHDKMMMESLCTTKKALLGFEPGIFCLLGALRQD